LPPYNCLTDYSYYYNTVCGYLPGVEYMNPPVYTATDAFKFLESLGTPQIMPIERIISSTYSGNSPGSSLCAHPIEAMENGTACGKLNPNSIVLTSCSMISSYSSPPSSLPGIAETLNSKLAGYLLIPYTYNVLISNDIASNSYQVFTYQTVSSSSKKFRFDNRRW